MASSKLRYRCVPVDGELCVSYLLKGRYSSLPCQGDGVCGNCLQGRDELQNLLALAIEIRQQVHDIGFLDEWDPCCWDIVPRKGDPALGKAQQYPLQCRS